MMQTLEILGADPFGRRFDRDPSQQHIDANPKGFFEFGPLYAKGLRSPEFKYLKTHGHSKSAFKTDLRNFVDGDAGALWQEVSAQITCVFVSIRIPCEQTVSEVANFSEASQSDPAKRLEELQMSGLFLQTYQQSFDALESRLAGDLSNYRSRVHAVDYAQARTQPKAYVARIAQCAKLAPTEDMFKRAAANIEAGLYRNKQEDLRESQGKWAKQTGAQASYERIKALLG